VRRSSVTDGPAAKTAAAAAANKIKARMTHILSGLWMRGRFKWPSACLFSSAMTKAFLFDIDGTLVDSVDLHTRSWQEAFRHFGHEIPFDAIRSQIGKGGDQLLPVFLEE
jgi:hypothetical protein